VSEPTVNPLRLTKSVVLVASLLLLILCARYSWMQTRSARDQRHSGNRLVTWLLNPVIGKPLNPQSLPTLNGIAAVRGTDSALVAVGQNGTILRTDDGGRSWRQLLSGTGTSLHSIAFSTRLSGWAVGDDGTILHTADGGANWRSQTIGTGARLQRVIFISEEQGWVVGADGLILATRDGGAS
jgi:photosystem II stability/assembly factor-like uncharacterized protein